MKKNEVLYNELKDAQYGDLFFCGFKDRHNDVKRLLENKLINNMYLLEFLRKEKCDSYKHGWNYYFLEFDMMHNEIKEVRHFFTLKDGYVDATPIIAKYPLSKTQLLQIEQENREMDESCKRLEEEISEMNRLDAIRKDNELREKMG